MCQFPLLVPALIFVSILNSASGVSVSDELYKYDPPNPPFYHTPYTYTPYAHQDPHYPFSSSYPEPPLDNYLPGYPPEPPLNNYLPGYPPEPQPPPFHPSPQFDPYSPLPYAPPDGYEEGFTPVEPGPSLETQPQAPELDPVPVLEVTTSRTLPEPQPAVTTTQAPMTTTTPSPPLQYYIFIDKRRRERGRGRSGRQRIRVRDRHEDEYGRDEDDIIRYLVKYQPATQVIQGPQTVLQATVTTSTSTTPAPPPPPSPVPTFSAAPNSPQPVSVYRLPPPRFDSHPFSIFYPPPLAHNQPHPAPHPHPHPHGFLLSEPLVTHPAPVPHEEPQHVAVPLRGYSFAYSVNDPHTLDYKSVHESREGGLVQGAYSLLQPDGVLRTVTYSAHPAHGFHAIVSNSQSHSPPT